MLATGGTTPFTWTASNLPTGLSINSASGVISGSPTAVGTFNTTITVTDKTGVSTNQTGPIVINDLPTISNPATLPSPWTQGSAYPTTQILTSNGTATVHLGRERYAAGHLHQRKRTGLGNADFGRATSTP